jgi:Leucine-rich repeat (LRR) protein
MEVSKNMEILQNILYREPDEKNWIELISSLENWQENSSLSEAIEYAERQLIKWPNYLRTAPSQSWKASQTGTTLPSWWKLVRHIELDEDDNIQAPFPAEGLKNITSIQLQENCCFSAQELNLLADLNKLGVVGWYDLIASLEEWPEDKPMDKLLNAAEKQLSHLPDEERTITPGYWQTVRAKTSLPRWWKLVRHLKLAKDDRELSPFEAFTNLTSLDISYSRLISIELLAKLTNLTSLKLVDELVPFNIEPLGKLTNLISLKLALPHLTNIDVLASLINLERLNLSYRLELSNFGVLATLKKLRWLSLEECAVLTDLTPLRQLASLRYLNLSNCKSITDISPLAGLNQLQLLDISGCEALNDLSPLAGLRNCNIRR